jgi:4-amino-4-deoxy-L-arabinose transferase-like glycosyltransferase
MLRTNRRPGIRRLKSWHTQLIVFLLFLAGGLALIIPRLSHYHGDEAFYTNASVRMVQTGDYWNPYYADGRGRFVKPILTYWAVVGSYQLFGINYFSSRFVFVLAGCLVVYLTSRLSLSLFDRPDGALGSALIAGSNLQLLTLSIRSTPDILVILFTLMSWWGFARIIFRGERSLKVYLLAYVGAALAVETKGLLGIFPVAFSFLYCVVCKDRALKWSALFHLPSLAIALVVGGFWYAVVFAKNGASVFSQFFSDQLTAKVSLNPWFGVQSFASYTFAGVRHFLPWTLLLLMVALVNPKGMAEFYRKRRRECWFIGGAFVLLAICFSFGNMRRTRYVALAYPLLAVLLAQALIDCLQPEQVKGRLAVLLRWSAGAVVVGGVLVALAGFRISALCLISGLVLVGCAGWLFSAARPRLGESWMLPLSCLLVGGFLIIENVWRPVFSVSPTPQLAAGLRSGGSSGGRVCALQQQPRSLYPDQLRVLLGGRFEVVEVKAPDDVGELAPLIVTEAQCHSLPEASWSFSPAGYASRKWPTRTLRKVFLGPDPRGTIATNVETYFIARRAVK